MKKVKAKTTTRKQIKKSSTKTTSEKTIKSVQTGIKILKYAAKNKTSVSEAARKNDFGRNYVSDIKARIDKNYKNRSITKELYDSFKTSLKNYEASQK